MTKFIPRQRKHKVLARQQQSTRQKPQDLDNDSNQLVLHSISQSERESKRQQLRDELRTEQPKISAQKRKRLDKYIENKLRKDENIDYLHRLEKEKEKYDVRDVDGFLSSKTLRKKVKSKKRAWDQFVLGQTDGEAPDSVTRSRTSQNIKPGEQTHHIDDDFGSDDSFEIERKDLFDDDDDDEMAETETNIDKDWLTSKTAVSEGIGLAQPLELGTNGLPVIPMRNRRKRLTSRVEKSDEKSEVSDSVSEEDDEPPWEGFDTENGNPENDEADSEFEDDGAGTSSASLSTESREDDASTSQSNVESDSDDTGSEAAKPSKIRTRTSAFKAWATQQLNQSIGHTPSYSSEAQQDHALPSIDSISASTKRLPKDPLQLINGLPEVKGAAYHRRVYSVPVHRSQVIDDSRSQLPVLRREQEIMEAIHNNSVVIIQGDTGSGKTTQIPQFLFEAGYGDAQGPTTGLIGITQPKRVAAVSMAKRVAEELGSHGNRVSHQIRFDSTVSAQTAIKFMTDGILVRELSQDLLLQRYSAIIIDEAHERSVNTDVLIGMLSKIVPARMRKTKFNPDPKPLKLIIMSATLNIDDFLHEKLFSAGLKPPIIEVEGRQHRVTTHFARKSRFDYLDEVIEKVSRAHHKLPRGGMLIFLTGQNEIRQVQVELKKKLARSSGKHDLIDRQPRMHAAAREAPLEIDDLDFGVETRRELDVEDDQSDVQIFTDADQDNEDEEFDVSDDEVNTEEFDAASTQSLRSSKDPYDFVHILPLYSQLPAKEQLRIFEPPPDRSRLIILATNVAETSITIPGIRYVFDCGRSKERRYNLETGIQSFEIDYISKASAQQRAGRAGRTGPGHCWRLYSSAVFERFFPNHTEPEISKTPAENVVLQIKSFAYPRPVVDFPFPTPPSLQSLQKAELLLRNLGALDSQGLVTGIGKQLSNFPLSPRLGKILSVAATDKGTRSLIIALVAGLAIPEIFVNDAVAQTHSGDEDKEDTSDQSKQAFGRAKATLIRHDNTSDALKVLTAVTMYVDAADKDAFCKEYFLRPKAMLEVSQLLQQLKNILQANYPGVLIEPMKTQSKLSSVQVKQLNSMAASGYIDQVAVRWDCAPNPPALNHKPRRTIDVPYIPLTPLVRSASSDILEKATFIHPTSVLARLAVKDLPQYLIYSHLQRAQSRTIGAEQSPKTRMFPLTPIDGTTLTQLAHNTALLEYGKPVPKTRVEDLPGMPKRRICWLSTELRSGVAGTYGWPLPPVKVKQVMDVQTASGWRTEEVLM